MPGVIAPIMGVAVPEQINHEIAAILREIAELPSDAEITPAQNLKSDLDIDSLKMIDVVVRVEAVLDVELGDEFSADVLTVGDLQRHVHERVAA